eukprot:CAMPEP_0184484808 /NCGR_PEP_ID=MMETSP0113_2-20130426/6482_1 /TAXON_ID=91329 /ORGANISM="Norrisiella sphaerica, Strain BC52" /LENGTH=294 /DNA_ID=CAMNT_0026865957 /DNA_START=361 /DNA_END=1245 /DNA_ORIENTATION=-
MASRKDRMSDSMSGSPSFEYTHLEVNAQLWKFAPSHGTKETSILVDPLIGALDFGLPDGVYSAGPAVLRNTEALVKQIVDSQPKAILITQSLDDHLHPPTLKLLKEKIKVPFIVIGPPSARERLRGIFDSKNIRVLPPGKSVNVKDLTVTATRGSLVGPPWQAPENGYVVTWDGPSVYYEPHNDVDVRTKLKGITADIVIAPMKSQKLPFFTLVYGKDRALQLASHLKASYLIPLRNGEREATGVLSALIQGEEGTEEVGDDKEQKAEETARGPDANLPLKVLANKPGIPVTVA